MRHRRGILKVKDTRMLSKIVGLITLFALVGCASQPPGGAGASTSDAASIKYNLPYTHARVTTTLTLKSCQPTVKAAASVAITPVAAPSPVDEEQFEISGSALRSLRKDREVSVSLHENRALKAVNASVTDKTPTIIGNVIKLATLFAAPSTTKTLACTPEIDGVLTNAKLLEEKITKLQKKYYDSTHNADKVISDQINVLAAELARLNTGPLQVKLSKTVAIQPEINAGYITWNKSHFRKWVEHTEGIETPGKLLSSVKDFKLIYCIWNENEKGSCTKKLADDGNLILACRLAEKKDDECKDVPTYSPNHVNCKRCTDTLVFREPVMANFVVASGSDSFIRASETEMKSQKMMISQWGKAEELPMSVGFGGSKSLSLTLDPFGQRTAFSWKSGSSAEAVTGALATLGEKFVEFRDRDDGESLSELTSEATYLEAQQKLNRLEACREIIESGGYVCPGSE